jgi:hypothetical protein
MNVWSSDAAAAAAELRHLTFFFLIYARRLYAFEMESQAIDSGPIPGLETALTREDLKLACQMWDS